MYNDKVKEKAKRLESLDDESDEDNDEAVQLQSTPTATVTSPPSPPSTDLLPDTDGVVPVDDNSENDGYDGRETEGDDSDSDVPLDYLFPSFYVFVLYGPFVPPSDRLDINLVDNKKEKKGEGTRAELRKKGKIEKATDS